MAGFGETAPRGVVYDEEMADEVLPAEHVDSELGRLLLQGPEPEPEPELEPEPEPELELELEQLAPLPGAIDPLTAASQLSIMAHRSAGPAKDKVAARHVKDQIAVDTGEVNEMLAERHVFSNVKYAEKVAAKRRARNRTEGNFVRESRRKSFLVTKMATTAADARASLTGHHTSAHVTAEAAMADCSCSAMRRACAIHKK
jgi:hypothetical protein